MNYQSIYNTILDYLARDDVSLSLYDTWLRIVEKKINAELTTSEEYTVVTLLYDDGIVLPDDFKQGVVTKVSGNALQYVTPQEFASKEDIGGFFTIKNKKMFISGNIGNIDVEIEYNKKLTPLVSGTTNYISLNYPDLYISGLLVEAGFWAKDERLSQLHAAKFDDAMNDANSINVNQSMSGSQLAMSSDLTYIGGQ